MFEMAFLQRKEFRVLHEPLGEPYYYGPQRMSNRFNHESKPEFFEKYGKLSFAAEWRNIVEQGADGKPRTFVKDMAHYIIPPSNIETRPDLPDSEDGNPTVIPSHDLLNPDIHHAFLVRSPTKAVPSYYRLCIPPKSETTGFDYFEPEEVGLKESQILYDWLVSKGQTPTVITAEDLLQNPIQVMSDFCEACRVDFSEDMCTWTGGEVQEHFKKWSGFHDDAEKSTGIARPAGNATDQASREAQKLKEAREMPKIVQEAIESNMATYQYMAGKAATRRRA